MQVICHVCGTQKEFNPHEYCCDCGGPWEPVERQDFDPASIDLLKSTLWRYQAIFDLEEVKARRKVSA